MYLAYSGSECILIKELFENSVEVYNIEKNKCETVCLNLLQMMNIEKHSEKWTQIQKKEETSWNEYPSSQISIVYLQSYFKKYFNTDTWIVYIFK